MMRSNILLYALFPTPSHPQHIRVETSTDFATRVPDIHYPTGTRVLVTVNLVSD